MKILMITAALLLFAGIAFGQTLKKGCVIGVHHNDIVLQEGMSMDDFIKFYEQKYIPAFEKAIPGLNLFLMVGERGEEANNIGLIFYFESVEDRNQHWPEKDVTSEKTNAALEEYLGPLDEELLKIVKSSTGGHTDWKVL